jgi:membrane-bound metal-dependent hydrolase YbcI (DUF457 family)
MDIITHILFGNFIRKPLRMESNQESLALISATLIPDIGEVFIQNALAIKYNAEYAVYDTRTSDAMIASNLNVTWIYDLFHSVFFAFALFSLSRLVFKSKLLLAFSVGLFSHILLDCATHGKVWALKLFFPLSNKRFELFVDSLGNWWDWKPTINLPIFNFPFPMVCGLIWSILIFSTILINKNAKIKNGF